MRQALSSLGAASLQHVTAVRGAHAHSEAVGCLLMPLIRLVSSFHGPFLAVRLDRRGYPICVLNLHGVSALRGQWVFRHGCTNQGGTAEVLLL